MKPLADNPSKMPRSGIREIMDLAAGLPGVIHLEVGEPDFDTPSHIIEASVQAARGGYTKYTPNAGILSLRKAIVEKMRRRNGLEVSPQNVVVSTGGVGGITSALFSLVDAGEEVMIPDPGWPNYVSAVYCIGATPLRYPLDAKRDFLPDLEVMAKLVTEKTKVLLINSPSNPTGAVFSRRLVEDLVAFARQHDLYLVSDEVYEDIIFEGEHVGPGLFDTEGRVVGAFSFSKSYAMTGWRVGYVVAPEPIAQVIMKIQEPFASCVCGVAQKAAEAALLGPQDCVREMRDSYKKRRDMAVEVLRSHGLLRYVPHGAFYIMVDISSTGMESYAFARALIKEQQVAVAPGGTFGDLGKTYVRVSLATAEKDLREGLERIGRFINSAPKG